MLSIRVVVVVVVGSGEVQPCLVVGSTPQLRLVTRPVNIVQMSVNTICSKNTNVHFSNQLIISFIYIGCYVVHILIFFKMSVSV